MDFYSKCEALELPLIFSGGQMKSRKNILAGRTEIISNMYFPLKSPTGANAAIPKGTYAVGYVRVNCEKSSDTYAALRSFIEESNMKIIGNSYEEYLLDELAESNPDRFVMKIMIQVE